MYWFRLYQDQDKLQFSKVWMQTIAQTAFQGLESYFDFWKVLELLLNSYNNFGIDLETTIF